MKYENVERGADFVLERIKELKEQKYDLAFYEAMDNPDILRMDVMDCDITVIMSDVEDGIKGKIKGLLDGCDYRWFD